MTDTELYPGQAEVVAGKLEQEEALQQADRELLKATDDPLKRSEILRRIAGREGSLSTRRRFLATLTGDLEDGPRTKVIRLRLSDDEYAQIQSAAAEAGVTLSQYIRSKIL